MAYLNESTYAIARAARGGSLGGVGDDAATSLPSLTSNNSYLLQFDPGITAAPAQSSLSSILNSVITSLPKLAPRASAQTLLQYDPAFSPPPSAISATTWDYIGVAAAAVFLLIAVSGRRRR